jgi:spermidine synthase
VKPTTTVAETAAPDGQKFRLYHHDGSFFLYMGQRQIMCTRKTHSEKKLAEIGCSFSKPRRRQRVLIGGLGLGFSLRRALEVTGPEATCEVAELLPEIIRWNHELVDGRNDDILTDRRTSIYQGDVHDRIRQAADKGPKYDSILLDVDDGPDALIQPRNSRIYNRWGLNLLKQAISPGGRIAFWTAAAEPELLRNLRGSGFRAEEFPVARYAGAKQKRHRIYLAEAR